jgi:hypothetical protein
MPVRSVKRVAWPAAAVAVVVAATAACSPKQIGMNRMADALTTTASLYSRDNDIELVRAAAPSTLKLVEMVLEDRPNHPGLLTTACKGFTQYSYGFLHVDAELQEASDPVRAEPAPSTCAIADSARRWRGTRPRSSAG